MEKPRETADPVPFDHPDELLYIRVAVSDLDPEGLPPSTGLRIAGSGQSCNRSLFSEVPRDVLVYFDERRTLKWCYAEHHDVFHIAVKSFPIEGKAEDKKRTDEWSWGPVDKPEPTNIAHAEICAKKNGEPKADASKGMRKFIRAEIARHVKLSFRCLRPEK